MAHAVHLTPSELELCVARGTGIACCPLSNFYFSGGAFPLRRAQALPYSRYPTPQERVGLRRALAGVSCQFIRCIHSGL